MEQDMKDGSAFGRKIQRIAYKMFRITYASYIFYFLPYTSVWLPYVAIFNSSVDGNNWTSAGFIRKRAESLKISS